VRKNNGRQDTAALIVAGGKGLRFGGPVRKQYLLLKGKPIVWWSLQAFEKSPSVRSMILVVPAEDVSRLHTRARTWMFRKLTAIVPGGVTRADSVREGLRVVPEACRYVAVHDAVRPLIKPETIEKVIQAARRSKAALAACLSKDTVKLANGDGYIHSTPAREKVWMAQTPQAFEIKLLKQAHQNGKSASVTDDAMLVERLGVKVRLVDAPADNMKITTPVDLMIAHAVMASDAKR
jgi:2-C-methyl-D-erythritol 4-phosphate cytidylyltransferase